MSRPSHWILGFFAVVGGALWWTGALREYLAARPADPQPQGIARTDVTGPGVDAASADGSGTSGSARGANPGVSVKRSNPTRIVAPKPAMSEVSGTLVDRRGWPVIAARVRLLGELRGAGDAAAQFVETDASGRFRIQGPSAVNRMLRIEAPGRHAPLEVRGSVEDLALVMQDPLPWSEPARGVGAVAPAVAPVDDLLIGEGWIRDHAGAPALGASIIVRETGASTRVDAEGHFILPLPVGPFTLFAWSPAGEVAVTDTAQTPRRQGKLPLPEVHLAPGLTLRGRLRDEDGQSLSDAAIVIANADVERTVRSEQGGLFVVPGVVDGPLTVSVLPARGHVGRRISAMVAGDADLGDVIIMRAEQEPLRIAVTDPAGTPQPFVHVVADQAQGLCRAYAQADVKGVAVFVGLGAGDTRFEVRNSNLEVMQVSAFDAAARRLIVAP